MAKKNNEAAKSSHTHFGFDPIDVEFEGKTSKKIVGPGTNPDEVKFEGDSAGPSFVHCKNGQPLEAIYDHATPAEGWFVRFGGTKEECEAFATRGHGV